MASLAEIRAKLAAMEQKSSPQHSDNTLYPFWNMNDGDSCTVRFLPDANPNNTFFWIERQQIKLTFPGVKGGDTGKQVTVQVPCVEMYGDTCPVLSEVRAWFKDPSLEEVARKYWKKRSYIFQGLVKENPMKEDSSENPIRRFVIGPQLFKIITSSLMDPDMENIPTDYEHGCDFRLVKGNKGQFADYSTSKWSRKETALTDEELAKIDEFGLFDLNEFVPARPSAEAVQAIAEMFHASVDGELYDPNRWGRFYKPWGLELDNAPTSESAAPKAAAPVAAEPDDSDDISFAADPVVAKAAAPQTEADASPAKKSADDIMAMIRSRSKA
jgi:hypothetical protein